MSAVLSCVAWTRKLLPFNARRAVIYKHLKLLGKFGRGDKARARKFINGVLRLDGVFLVHIIGDCAGTVPFCFRGINASE